MKRVGWILLLVAMAAPAWAKTKITKQTFEFQGAIRTYYSYVPEQTGPMPIVLILHGFQTEPWIGLPYVEEWKDLASKEHFIVVAPTAAGFWDRKLNPPEFFHAVINQVKAQHPIDSSRIYLFGHSIGAPSALFLGLLDSNYYAAVAVHSGSTQDSRPTSPKILPSTRRIPVAIITGSLDELYPPEEARATKDSLVSHGFPVMLSILYGDAHDYFPRAGQTNRQAWDFMKKTQLTQPPVATK